MTIVGPEGRVAVLGGEADSRPKNEALKAVEAFDVQHDQWTALPSMVVGRHTGGAMVTGLTMIAAAGVGKMGGSPLLTDTEAWTGA